MKDATTKTKEDEMKKLSKAAQTRIRRCGLAGCPEMRGCETDQALRRIADELPRGVRLWDAVSAMYRVNANGRYEIR